MVEGTPLLRVHLGKTWIQGSNPCVSAKYLANMRPSGRFVFVYAILYIIFDSMAAVSSAPTFTTN